MKKLNEVSVGLWIDCPKKDVLNEGYFRTLGELKVDSISIMIDNSDQAVVFNWDEDDVAKVLELAHPHCIEVVLTTWPYPIPKHVDTMAAKMEKLLKVDSGSGVCGWEVDLEFNWKARFATEFQNAASKTSGRKSAIDIAGSYLVASMRKVSGDIRLELTTFAEHLENGKGASAAPYMDFLKVQAYSIRNRSNFAVPWDHTYGPGHMQKFTLDRTMLVPNFSDLSGNLKNVGCGLALWDQRWPNHMPYEAMRKALDSALSYNVDSVVFWSSKHLIGNQRNPYALPWLQTLATERG